MKNGKNKKRALLGFLLSAFCGFFFASCASVPVSPSSADPAVYRPAHPITYPPPRE